MITFMSEPLGIIPRNLTHLEEDYDDDEESVGGEEDPALLDGAAVAEEGEHEDEGAARDQHVRTLLDHRGLGQLLER